MEAVQQPMMHEKPVKRQDQMLLALEAAKARFLALCDAPRGDEPAWLVALRKKGRDVLSVRGLPSVRDEAWKYTNVAPVVSQSFASRNEQVRGLSTADERARVRLVFVDGVFSAERSVLPALRGVVLNTLRQALVERPGMVEPLLASLAHVESHGFLALNTAAFTDGVFLFVEPGTQLEHPIHIVCEGSGVAQLRHVIAVGASARVEVVEHYIGAGDYFTGSFTEASLAENAELVHTRLQEDSTQALHVGGLYVTQARDSRFVSHNICLGGALARVDLTTNLEGEGADAKLYGLYLPKGTQVLDNFTSIGHLVPRCTSSEVYKGVLDDQSRGVWTGKILVEKDAQKTAAEQSNKNLLLKDTAHVDARPQLEIYADDVKCSHGAAIGSVDEDSLFYLRSRGIGEAESKRILTYAFTSEVVEKLPAGPLRESLTTLLHTGLLGDA